MDIQKGFNSRGSFGIPEHMKKQLEAQQRSAPKEDEARDVPEPAPVSSQEAQSSNTAADPGVSQARTTTEEDKQKDIEELRKVWETRLGIKITERDVRDYIFKGRLIKDGVEAIPGFMSVTFQSMNPEEIGMVDERMAEFRETKKFTPDGLSNENSLQILSYGWLKAAEVSQEAETPNSSKSLGKTPEERYKTIKKMSALAVQEVAEAWDGFNVLVKIALKERRLLKKS